MAAFELRDVPGKGRGLFTARPIEAGEAVVTDMPLVLYPQESFRRSVCSFCLRALAVAGASAVTCQGCQQAAFCTTACAAAAAADPASHSPLICRCLTSCNLAGLSDDQASALHFLLRAAGLKLAAAAGDAAAAARLSTITSLAGAAASCDVETRELHGRLAHSLAAAGVDAACLSLQEAGDLLRKDGINGYGIMAPSGPEGERRIRGGGLYPTAALVNHECLPNLARFDCFDAPSPPGAPPGANTAIQLRALHAIPQGEELTQSYFPLPWPYKDRQEQCQEQYGFECNCPRCKEESTWPSEDESEGEWMTDDGEGEEGEEGQQAAGAAVAEESSTAAGEAQADAAYISLFLLKYVCPQEDCQGTLAPQQGTDRFECNMCGLVRTEADFLAELAAAR